jgi:hypothetical protein
MAGVRATTPMFKPVPGGYVFRAPSPWIFWRRRFYLVNETQRVELLSILAARRVHRVRARIFMVALFGLIVSATMIVAGRLWLADGSCIRLRHAGLEQSNERGPSGNSINSHRFASYMEFPTGTMEFAERTTPRRGQVNFKSRRQHRRLLV